MIFEIANPSDPVTIESDDPKLVAITILVTSQGKYGVLDESGEVVMPVFLASGKEMKEIIDSWLQEHHGMSIEDLDAYMTENALRMADVLDTAMVCKPRARKSVMVALRTVAFQAAHFAKSIPGVEPPDEASFVRKGVEAWNDEQRTSMNDICKNCFSVAKALRLKHAERARAGMHAVGDDDANNPG